MDFTIVGVNEYKHVDEIIVTKNVYFDIYLMNLNIIKEFENLFNGKKKKIFCG